MDGVSTPTWIERLRTNSLEIKNIVNKNELFGKHTMNVVITNANVGSTSNRPRRKGTGNTMEIKFELLENGLDEVKPDNFSNVDYFINDNILQGFATTVMSDLGNKTGELLFNLQILLMTLSGVKILKLDNDADDAQRAAKGIYSLLKINRKLWSEVSFVDKKITFEEQLLMADGEMILNFNRNTYRDVKDKLIKIINGRNGNNHTKSTNFFKQINQYWTIGGGGSKRKTKKRKTRR